MKIRILVILLLSTFLAFGCSKYDTKKFVFSSSSDKYSDSIRLFQNSDLRIRISNPITSYPDDRYELGINTQLSFSNLGRKQVVIDSISIDQYHKNSNISDSVRVWLTSQSRYSFPIELCPEADGFPCNGINLIYHVDNSKHDFQIGDTINVKTKLWFKIDGKPRSINRVDKKIYRRFQGYYSL